MALPVVYLTNELDPRDSPHTESAMISALLDRYRCPHDFLQFELTGRLSSDSGYFRFGHQAICYGRSATGYRTPHADALLYGAQHDSKTSGSTVLLPFNPTEVIDNLRLERYARRCKPSEWSWRERTLRDAYYVFRPYMGVSLRKNLQRLHAGGWRQIAFPRWPVDTTVERLSEGLLLASMKATGVDRMPFVWFWPQGAKSCLVMTHDVEDQRGYNSCRELMDIDAAHGMRASFQLVPEGTYKVFEALLEEIRSRSCEVNIQDLNHDGYLFAERQEFLRRARKINRYRQAYAANGFRSAVMYRNFEWYDALDFSYDMSVPNAAHLDPQRGGCCTVFPYFVGDVLEIPLTTAQDYMLFHLLDDYSLNLWKTQVGAILKENGLISFLVHPDYVAEHRARQVYCELLRWVQDLITRKRLWCALPGELDKWWRSRSNMRVVRSRGEWQIEGPASERALLAFAKNAGDHIEYEIGSTTQALEGQDNPSAPSMVK